MRLVVLFFFFFVVGSGLQAAAAAAVCHESTAQDEFGRSWRMASADVLTGLFSAAYDGNLALVKSVLKNNAISADISDPVKVRSAAGRGRGWRKSTRPCFPHKKGRTVCCCKRYQRSHMGPPKNPSSFVTSRGPIVASLSFLVGSCVIPDTAWWTR